ncbi:MAG: co-chaperone DjlA [Gammaproteobacteria bacterium]|nr:MAG: co-chaperone DjlA [Gammaproteobacteria bacterium]
MSWLGAGIGAGIGLAMGGPIGAAFGAWLGSSFGNKKLNSSEHKITNQSIFFVTLCSMLAKLAKADGVVSQSEIKAVTGFFVELGLDENDKKSAIIIFNNAKDDNVSIYEYANQYANIADIKMREMVYAMLWQVAMADGVLHPQEQIILEQITHNLKINSFKYQEHKTNFGLSSTTDSDIDESYKILGCQASDSDKTIKQKYRQAVAEYHPDKLQKKGLPADFIKFANEQIKNINVAYDKIQKQRGK